MSDSQKTPDRTTQYQYILEENFDNDIKNFEQFITGAKESVTKK